MGKQTSDSSFENLIEWKLNRNKTILYKSKFQIWSWQGETTNMAWEKIKTTGLGRELQRPRAKQHT